MATISITSGGRERVTEASEVLGQAFADDPILAYLLCSMSREERLSYLPRYFKGLVTQATMNHAIIKEASGWKSCAVLVPPKSRVDNPLTMIPAGFIPMLWKIGIGGCQRMLAEYQPISDALKANALAGQKRFYYVFCAGTLVEARGNGLCSAIMRDFQEIASREQLPIWLEATTAESVRLYQNLGWEVADETLLGNGKANADGVRCEGGEGVKIWGMVWRPNKS